MHATTRPPHAWPRPRGLWRRARRRTLAISTLLVTFMALGTVQAMAGQIFPSPEYQGDPHIQPCRSYSPDDGNFTGLCMFTSEDHGDGTFGYYPMTRTKLYTLAAGASAKSPSSWVSRGVVVDESDLVARGRVPANSKHLWAPASVTNPITRKNYVFVPDLINGDNNRGSRIFVYESNRATGGYTFKGQVNTPVTDDRGPGINGGYASDPFVFELGAQFQLFYANGNFENCGSLSSASLRYSDLTQVIRQQRIYIDGLYQAVGGCRSANDGAMPYVEGPAVYLASSIMKNKPPTKGYTEGKYILMFSVKMTKVPVGCGSDGSTVDQQALAYATADSLSATHWQYRGIVMCPRGKEWTNHGSIAYSPADGAVLAFHDGPAEFHQRRTMLDCLTWQPNGHLNTVPVRDENFKNCNSWGRW